MLAGMHILEGNWLVVFVHDPPVPVLIRRCCLGSGEHLPGLLIGERVE